MKACKQSTQNRDVNLQKKAAAHQRVGKLELLRLQKTPAEEGHGPTKLECQKVNELASRRKILIKGGYGRDENAFAAGAQAGRYFQNSSRQTEADGAGPQPLAAAARWPELLTQPSSNPLLNWLKPNPPELPAGRRKAKLTRS